MDLLTEANWRSESKISTHAGGKSADDFTGERPVKTDKGDRVRRAKAAMKRVQRGQVSRARHELTGAPLAPKSLETPAELRRQRPQVRQSHIPQAVLDYEPEVPLKLDAHLFENCLRSAPSGSAPGPGGCTYEMLTVCLEDVHTLELLTLAAEDFARGRVPGSVSSAFKRAFMTALSKKDGGIRSIATGTSFRRLIAKCLARQFQQRGRSRLCTVPVCSVNSSWGRLRWPRNLDSDRSEPRTHCTFN